MGQARQSRIAKINIERSYSNRILQKPMNRINGIIREREFANLFFLRQLNLRFDLYIF